MSLLIQSHPAVLDRAASAATYNPVQFRFSNACNRLTHLVVYDLQSWSNPKNEDKGLFCMDAATDNIYEGKAKFTALSNNNIYLIRAYFDYSDEMQAFVQLPSNGSSFELRIYENAGEPYFDFGSGLKEIKVEDIRNAYP